MLGSLLCTIGNEFILGSAVGAGLNWAVLLVLPGGVTHATIVSHLTMQGWKELRRVQAGLPQVSGAAGRWQFLLHLASRPQGG